MKNRYTSVLLTLSFLLMASCGEDDGITPLPIKTNSDTVSLTQNSEIEIFIYSNDENIPSIGELNVSSPSKGTVIIEDSNTPNNPSDDFVVYKANPNEIGADSFQYTICDASGNCINESVIITIISGSNVVFNIDNTPYQTLSEYQFFQGNLKDLEPSFGVLPYTLKSTLFSDYAKKKRYVWMPNNTKATYISDDKPLSFPVGAVLIKNFYYENVLPNYETKIIETRLMIRKNENWIFANYIWNDGQTEAFLDLNGSTVNLQWQENDEIKTVQYRVPSEAKCFTCHKISETPEPIGPKPRNLNLTYNYTDGLSNQLDKLVDFGYLESTLPATISKLPDYNDTSEPLDLRVRAYLDVNCAHCHSEETHCAYRPMRFDFSNTDNYSNIGVCVDADTDLELGLGHIVEPGDARNSVLHFRLSSTDASYRMPLLGRTIVHTEGVDLIEDWINSLTNDCN